MASEAKVRVVLDVSEARQQAEHIREQERIVADHKKRAKRTWDKAAGKKERDAQAKRRDYYERVEAQFGSETAFWRSLFGKGVTKPELPLGERIKNAVREKRDQLVYGLGAAKYAQVLRAGGMVTGAERAMMSAGVLKMGAVAGVGVGLAIAAVANKYGAGVEELLVAAGIATRGGAITDFATDVQAAKSKILGELGALKDIAASWTAANLTGQDLPGDVTGQLERSFAGTRELRGNAEGRFAAARQRLMARGLIKQVKRGVDAITENVFESVSRMFGIR